MLTIQFNDQQFYINNTSIVWPLSVDTLKSILGAGRHSKLTYNHIYAWDDIGISAYTSDNIIISSIVVQLVSHNFKSSPKKKFTGSFSIDGIEIFDYFHAQKTSRIKLFKGDRDGAFIFKNTSVWFDIEEDHIKGISISYYEPAPKKESLQVDVKFSYYTALWQQWIAAIQKLVPENNAYYNLKQGIAQEDIDTIPLEEGFHLPDTLVNFYKVADVEYEPVASPFTFNIKNNQFDVIPFADIHGHWVGIQELCDGDIDEQILKGYAPAIKTEDYTNPRWIPIAEDRNGDYLLMDTDPGSKGVYGQIIELQNESWNRNVVADSLEQLIQQQIIHLNKGADKYMKFFLKKG